MENWVFRKEHANDYQAFFGSEIIAQDQGFT